MIRRLIIDDRSHASQQGQLLENRRHGHPVGCGYQASSKSLRSLSTCGHREPSRVLFPPPGDIPLYVANGRSSICRHHRQGFRGRKGRGPPHRRTQYHTALPNLCAAVPAGRSRQGFGAVSQVTAIATSFPNIVRHFFGGHDKLVELEGAVEISVKLGIADAVVDIVETGTTLKQAGLRIMGDLIRVPRGCVRASGNGIATRSAGPEKPHRGGKLLAQEYMMVETTRPRSS